MDVGYDIPLMTQLVPLDTSLDGRVLLGQVSAAVVHRKETVFQGSVKEEADIGIIPTVVRAIGNQQSRFCKLEESVLPIADPHKEAGECFVSPAAPDQLIRLGVFAVCPRLILQVLDSLHIGLGQFGNERGDHFDLSLVGPGHKLISFSHNDTVIKFNIQSISAFTSDTLSMVAR